MPWLGLTCSWGARSWRLIYEKELAEAEEAEEVARRERAEAEEAKRQHALAQAAAEEEAAAVAARKAEFDRKVATPPCKQSWADVSVR